MKSIEDIESYFKEMEKTLGVFTSLQFHYTHFQSNENEIFFIHEYFNRIEDYTVSPFRVKPDGIKYWFQIEKNRIAVSVSA